MVKDIKNFSKILWLEPIKLRIAIRYRTGPLFDLNLNYEKLECKDIHIFEIRKVFFE